MPPKGRILLAEDTVANVALYRTVLERGGFAVEVAEHGVEAAEKGASGGFDLILMDLGLPRIDGFEALERIRAAGVVVPVVPLTADDDAKTRRICEEAGMVGFLTKPLSPAELLKTVAQLIAKHAA
ncbi:MAG: response regulator [Pseudomonadota bacterium]